MKKHKHPPNASDPEAGVQEYVFVLMTCMRELGGARVMKGQSQAKNVIAKLATGLNPREVRELLFHDK